MALPFRRRIFVILVVMTTVPTLLAVAGWLVSVRRLLPAAGARASTERVASTARTLLEGVDTLHLTVHERALLRQHLDEVSASVSLARRAETFLRYYTAGVAVVILLLGAGVLYAAVNLAGHLSRQLSRPIDELVGWTSLIRRHEPLPASGGPLSRGAPEFESLRQALRELAAALAAARERELEAERLRAFREVARRVAHEIKNPLTSMRIAVDQLRRKDGMTEGRKETAMEGMAAETDRLERLAREIAGFWRPPAAVLRAVLHDETRRHGPRPRARAGDPRSASRHDRRQRDARRGRDIRDRLSTGVRIMSPRVLLVDDEANIRRMVGALLQSDGFETIEAPDGNAALTRVIEDAPDVVLLDLMMPPGPDGLATLDQIRKRAPQVPVVMMSGKANLSDAVRATKLGAFQFLEKPLTPEGVLVALRSALELGRTLAEIKRLHEQLGHDDPLVATSVVGEARR